MVPEPSPLRKSNREAPTIAQLISDAQTRIAAAGSDTPRLDAELLFRHVANLDRTGLFLALQDDVSEEHIAPFNALVDRRVAGMPVAYLVGHREFMGRRFAVTPDVLIPRPETELLVEWALERLAGLKKENIDIVDIGSGSGAIALSVAALTQGGHRVLAIEPSAVARDVIARNAVDLLTPDQRSRLTIADGDLLFGRIERFGMVLANLPYLTPEQIAGNPDLNAEPRMALDGGSDGIDLIRRLIRQLPVYLTSSFAVGLEIDPSQSGTVVRLLRETLPETEVSVIKDLAGFDRHVEAVRDAG